MFLSKFDFTIYEGKERLNHSRRKKLRQALRKEGGQKTCCVAFLLYDIGWCVHILTERCSLTSKINGMKTTTTTNITL